MNPFGWIKKIGKGKGKSKQKNKFLYCYECLRHIKVEDIKYRCYNANCPSYSSHLTVGDLVEGKCPEDNSPVRPICPKLHNMSESISSSQYQELAIAGAFHTGKSKYLAALYHVLKSLGAEYDFCVNIWPKEWRDEFIKDWYEPYIAGYDVKTISNKVFRKEIGPNNEKNWPGKPFSMIIYDGPGEDFWDIDIMTAKMGFLFQTEQIILLLDPYSIPILRNEPGLLPTLAPGIMSQIEPHSVDDVMLNLVQLYRDAGFVDRQEKINRKLAVVLTKADLLMDLISPVEEALLFATAIQNGKVNRSILERTSKACRRFLTDKLNLGDFIRTTEFHFGKKNVAYFLVSAKSEQPIFPIPKYKPEPRAVENPLLYLVGNESYE